LAQQYGIAGQMRRHSRWNVVTPRVMDTEVSNMPKLRRRSARCVPAVRAYRAACGSGDAGDLDLFIRSSSK
jgi:hypothetical protein